MAVDPFAQMFSLYAAARGAGAADSTVATLQKRVDDLTTRLEQVEKSVQDGHRLAKDSYSYLRGKIASLEDAVNDVKKALEDSLGPRSPSSTASS